MDRVMSNAAKRQLSNKNQKNIFLMIIQIIQKHNLIPMIKYKKDPNKRKMMIINTIKWAQRSQKTQLKWEDASLEQKMMLNHVKQYKTSEIKLKKLYNSWQHN